MDQVNKRPLGKGVWMKKLAAAAVLAGTLAYATPAATNANTKLQTVYHVYLDNTYVGTASDKQVTEEAVKNVIAKSQGNFSGYTLQLGNKLTYITEHVFRAKVNDAEVSQKIEQKAQVKAVATAIAVDGRTPIYLKNKAEAEAALKQLKLKFVSEEELARAEQQEELPALKEAGSRVTGVRIQEDVALKEEAVQPDQVLKAEEAVNMLLKGTLEEKKYKVQEGDVLGKIAAAHSMTSEQLMKLNAGLKEDSLLQIGQELNVTVTTPLVHVLVEREEYKEETVPFEKEVIEDSSMPKGEMKVKQEGKAGKSAYTYKVTEQNGSELKRETAKEEVLEQPVKHIVIKGTKVIPSRGTGSFAWPASGGYISSKMGQRWGKTHKGIDIARPSNYTIKAADNGVVVSAGWDGGYGNKIVIDHQNGFRTVYAHLASISVSPGQTVERGSAIGVMGSTGQSTGIHLHFEVYQNGSLKNPLDYL
ncbi:MAG TPA: M23 family metallopeptidase [Bacillaceae bacterium]